MYIYMYVHHKHTVYRATRATAKSLVLLFWNAIKLSLIIKSRKDARKPGLGNVVCCVL